jgi:uncharacterized damage-inducible protein DinB
LDPLEHIRRLWEHAFWADSVILDALRADPAPVPEALREFAHILGAEETWLARLLRRPPRAAVWPEGLSTEDLARLRERTEAEYRACLASLRPADLDSGVPYTNSAGRDFTSSVADILLQALLHGQYHRGKVSLLLRQAGRPPVALDYIAFVRGAPAATEATARAKGAPPDAKPR